ncbi:NAD(P)H-dependent flavin oxidoreductase [Microbacterium gilvum]|uniref:Propionate 3-nitronate monooxygenase n=1 Tax=Microbacterium gilvum TaxID=1336204 RepID=A0ABP8ZR72_9MICO
MTLESSLGIEHPVVLGPFGGVSSVALAVLVSEGGGLGSFGLYGYAPDRIAETVSALRSGTTRPFAVNLWVPTGDEVSPADVPWEPHAAVRALFDEVGVAVPARPDAFLPDPEAQLDAVIAARPAVLSTVFGVLSPDRVEAVHAAGIRLIGTATTVEEAVAVAESGADAVVATGSEAGGHRVSWLRPAEESLVGTFALVPQVVDAVDIPVIAAGGIADRRGVAAARALGADGVQVGTAFLRTRQSAAPDAHRAAIAMPHRTTLTRAMSGRLARGIPNRALRTLESAPVLPFPAQNWLTGRFRAEASAQDRGDLLSLWAGQAAALAHLDDAHDVLAELVAGLR